MDTKRIALVGGMVVLAGFMFVQMKKMGTPSATPVAQTQAPIVQKIEMSQVLVSTRDAYIGTRVTEDMLKWQEWPKDTVGAGFVTKDTKPTALDDFLGAVVRSGITEGEPITGRKLVKAGDRGVMSVILKPGMRAVSVRISTDTAAAGFINPGDHVDIIQTVNSTTSTGERVIKSATVFENVNVLAIDQTYTQGPDGQAAVLGSTALLELTQEDAELLAMTQSSGELSLTLRGLTSSRTRRGSAAKIQPNEEEKVSSLTLIRGGQVEQVTLKGQ